jgi:hypothetical protein
MVDSRNTEMISGTDYDCPVCMTLMVEPISVKCKHVICLTCTEKIAIEEQPKCPFCRVEFDFTKDLSFNSELFRNSLINHAKDFMKIAEKILDERYKNKGNIEYLISYGNQHKILQDQNGENKHEWTAFVKLRKGNNNLKRSIDKLKSKANLEIYFEKYQNIELKEKDERSVLLNDSQVIKQVTFFLHPTFNPSKIVISKAPFEVRRIGWGTFNIPIKVEFIEKLNIEPLELNFELSFTRSLNEQFRTFNINIDKLV